MGPSCDCVKIVVCHNNDCRAGGFDREVLESFEGVAGFQEGRKPNRVQDNDPISEAIFGEQRVNLEMHGVQIC